MWSLFLSSVILLFTLNSTSAFAGPTVEVRLARMPFGVCSNSAKVCKYWRPDGANSLAAREELYRNEHLESSIYVSPTATLNMQQQFAKIISAVNKAKRGKKNCKPEFVITSGTYKVNRVEVCASQLSPALNAQLKGLLR